MFDPFEPFRSIIESSKIYDESAKVVTKHLVMYYYELNKVEKAQIKIARKKDLPQQDLKKAISEKLKVFGEYWSVEDDYWKPCSISTEEEHKPECIANIFVLSDGRHDFIAFFDYEDKDAVLGNGKRSYLVRNIQGKPKIVNRFF